MTSPDTLEVLIKILWVWVTGITVFLIRKWPKK